MYRDIDFKMSTLVLKSKDFPKIREFFRMNPQALTNIDIRGRNLLHWAVSHRDIKLVKLLFALGVPIKKDKLGLSPLEVAKRLKAAEIINLLS